MTAKTPARAPRRAGTAAAPDQYRGPGAAAPLREYVIELPPGLKLLSLNGRYHWAERNRRNAALKKAAWAMAVNAKVPALAAAAITVEYQPPDARHRDADNLALAGKACIDGIVAAKVLPSDTREYVRSVTYKISELQFPKGRLVLRITEVTP